MPEQARRYRVTMKETVIAWNVLFEAGRRYIVSARVYDSMVENKAFKDLCDKVEPLA